MTHYKWVREELSSRDIQTNSSLMIKCKVHIFTENTFMDDNVCVKTTLPCLPHIGDVLYIDKYELEQKAKRTLEIAGKYAEWFYGESSKVTQYGENSVKRKNLKDLSFSDAIFVRNVLFNADDEFVHIELSDETLFEVLRRELECV